VLPSLLAQRPAGHELRIWCAGCASGEEAYSVAMLLGEALGPAFADEDIKIFGTDLDEAAVAWARRGEYSTQQLTNVRPERRERWFERRGDGWAVGQEIRRKVVFGINNLISDAPISRLDLLLCRNVFIYLEPSLQKQVLTCFHYALRQHGVLMLGQSEMIPFASQIFDSLDRSRRLYRKDGRCAGGLTPLQAAGLMESSPGDAAPDAEAGTDAGLGFVEQFHRDVLQSVAAPIIATALDGTVTVWNRASTALWQLDESAVLGKKLSTLGLMGLSGDLLIEKTAAVREGKSERQRGETSVPDGGDGRPRCLAVNVWPLRDLRDQVGGLLYVVEDVTGFRELEHELRRVNEERQSTNEALHTTNQELQTANEELETANEELQAVNEELQTSNEALQSTVEELEASNEELQSASAELDATNRELQHRTEEMHRACFTQRTLSHCVSAGVVVLDVDGQVTLWNGGAERWLGLGESEALGRSFWTLPLSSVKRATLQRVRKAIEARQTLAAEPVVGAPGDGEAARATLTAVPILDGTRNRGAVLVLEERAAAVHALPCAEGRVGRKRRR
jgi:two-component system CheB/CheR fusion protein